MKYGIFESTGQISVMRYGREVDPELLVDVMRPGNKSKTKLQPPPSKDDAAGGT
ncbi:hypothetical protein [Ornithinimicrobium sp. INDO-MA30-4]|uniref:hypothetical protein n=1 Tax=Ornithinimicrobium sp. INDO-MA30-4 TaxID=2908651 RepID=UPI001F28F139|nr:hypothetical protein [Ornithinimicrobium sp. INDO-MA30-4]UJH70149.1 hypothetical protein L0A91_13280 [Ornithinimicrobium sp. INDO-MA30-4]